MQNTSAERKQANFKLVDDKWTAQQHLRNRVSFADHRAIGFELVMPFFYRKPIR